MNKAELKAIQRIAKKLNWQNRPVMEVLTNIEHMVHNQQSLELDCIGECDDFEETLLSIAIWDADKIASTQYVNDYQSLVFWKTDLFCEDMGISWVDLDIMLDYAEHSAELTAEEIEAIQEQEWKDGLEECMSYEDYNLAVYHGWI